MSNEEVNKILSMLEKNELENLKKYLLKELYINNDANRQKTFENYLTNKNNITRICENNGTQKFTNGNSIYIINSNLLNLETFKLEKNKKEYKIVSDDIFENYLMQLSYITNFDTNFNEIDDLNTKNDDKYVYVRPLKSKNSVKIYDNEEIKVANIILNNPKYYVSDCAAILKAESDIGKAYILSLK